MTISTTKNPLTLVNDASVGLQAWTNPGNAAATDDAYASFNQNTVVSNYLKASNFGFAIPFDATILGIQVRIERKQVPGSGHIVDSQVKLLKGGTPQATNKADAGNWPQADAYQVYGGSADLWGTTWTPADINASNFGAVLAARADILFNVTANVDHIEITVFWQLYSNKYSARGSSFGSKYSPRGNSWSDKY